MLRLKLNFISWRTLLSFVIRFAKLTHTHTQRNGRENRNEGKKCIIIVTFYHVVCNFHCEKNHKSYFKQWARFPTMSHTIRAKLHGIFKIATYRILLTTFVFTSDFAEKYFNIHCLFFNCTLSLILACEFFFSPFTGSKGSIQHTVYNCIKTFSVPKKQRWHLIEKKLSPPRDKEHTHTIIEFISQSW